jgi:putative endonuclease
MNVNGSAGARIEPLAPLRRGKVRAIVPPMAYDGRQLLGKSGEELACTELQRRGYAILDRRYRTRFGEIDIVARDGDVTVFIEVKARAGRTFGDGAAAVTTWKQRRVAQMAVDYVARHGLHDRPCRFDVVVVDFVGGQPRVQVYAHAFDT